MALWITGIPGSGKSTVAEEIRARRPGFVVLRMDDLRRIATPSPTYGEEERDLLYRSLVFTASLIYGLGHSVIIDATGHKQAWRDLARKLIPRFFEVYLSCGVDVAKGRERGRLDTHGAPRDIYDKAASGWPVPGVSVPYEEPVSPEIVVRTDKVGIEETARLIEELIGRLRS